MEVYLVHSPQVGCYDHDDVSKSLSLGLQSILHKGLSSAQFIWLHLAMKAS